MTSFLALIYVNGARGIQDYSENLFGDGDSILNYQIGAGQAFRLLGRSGRCPGHQDGAAPLVKRGWLKKMEAGPSVLLQRASCVAVASQLQALPRAPCLFRDEPDPAVDRILIWLKCAPGAFRDNLPRGES
jgi:hypothetical protein